MGRLIDNLKGKRVVIGFRSSDHLQITVAKLMDSDEETIMLETETPKQPGAGPLEIKTTPNIITYVDRRTIDSITDASNEEVFKMIIAQMSAIEAGRAARMKAAQNGPLKPEDMERDGEGE